MTHQEILEMAPHYNLIVENGKVHIPSIFMFKYGMDELSPFMYACKEKNCTVVFDNEELTITPHDNAIRKYNIWLCIYATMATTPRIPNNYIRYLENQDKMQWENCKKENGQTTG